MADLDAELARFEAELAQVEQSVAAEPSSSEYGNMVSNIQTSSAPAFQPAIPPSSVTTQNTTTYTQQQPYFPPSHPPSHTTSRAMAPPPAYPPPQVPQPAASYYTMPQYGAPPVQQMQIETYEETAEPSPTTQQPANASRGQDSLKRRKDHLRLAGGEKWKDHTLSEWPENDYRIFVGDLGNEVTDELLTKAFNKYPTFAKAKVVRDKRTNKTKGFGFVSFLDSTDFAKALREMNGKYIGNRPCKLRKSSWDERNFGQKKRELGVVAEALKKARY